MHRAGKLANRLHRMSALSLTGTFAGGDLARGLRSASTLPRVSAARRLAPAAASGALGGRPDARGSRLTARFSADGDTTGSMGGGSLASRLLSQSNFTSSSASSAKAAAKPAAKPAKPAKPAAAAKAPAVESNNSAERDAKKKALDRVLGEIDANFGKGSIMKLGQASQAKVSTFPSGAMTLDIALGGGMPRGRIVEIYGPESSGKTTLAMHCMAEMQKIGGTVALIDAEHAFDPEYSQRLGLDVDEVVVCQPETGEMALEVVDTLVRSNAVDLVVVDSVAALVPRSEIEGEIGMVQVGAHARLMSQALRKINVNAAKAGVTIIFLNQLRSKVGVIYGNPEITTGGNALKFYASVRLDIRRKEVLKGKAGSDDEGVRVKVKVAKNKVAPPYKTAEFDMLFGRGISSMGCTLDAADEMGVIDRRGSWYSYDDEKLGQGRDKAMEFLRENPAVLERVEADVRRVIAERLAGKYGSPIDKAEAVAPLGAFDMDSPFDLDDADEDLDLGAEEDLAAR